MEANRQGSQKPRATRLDNHYQREQFTVSSEALSTRAWITVSRMLRALPEEDSVKEQL